MASKGEHHGAIEVGNSKNMDLKNSNLVVMADQE